MKTVHTSFLICGLTGALVMGLPLPAAHAQTDMQAPASGSSLEANPARVPQGTVKTLGTLPKTEAPAAAMTADTASSNTAIPEVAPAAETATPWSTILPPQKAGDITYITGGIGDDERNALAEAKKEFNLYIMSAEKGGAFVGDTQIVIRTAKGDQVLNVTAGPMLYAKIPPGAYTVEASAEGQTKKEKVTIGAKSPVNVHFSW